MNDLTKYITGVAAKSNVEKRQVGCVLVLNGEIVAEGYNIEEPGSAPVHAEDMAIEALVAEGAVSSLDYGKLKAYVTHPPCPSCAKHLAHLGVSEVEVVEAFMKFDGDKTRYDLVDGGFGKMLYHAQANKANIPSLLFDLECQLRLGADIGAHTVTLDITEAILEHFDFSSTTEVFTDIAEVLTFGARKYKPNNWRQCEDFGRYLAAAWRHWFAIHKEGELVDPESGLRHVAHFMTNIMFLHTKLVQNRNEK